MKEKLILSTILAGTLVLTGCANDSSQKGSEESNNKNHASESKDKENGKPYSDVAYPKDGVKGVYVSANSTNGEKFKELTTFIDETDLNAMVIDVKDDTGNVTINFNTGNKQIDDNTIDIVDAKPLLKKWKKRIFIQSQELLLLKTQN